MDICPKCGLPLQACVCKEIAKTEQRIKIETDKRRYGKIITLVAGLSKEVDMKDIAKAYNQAIVCPNFHAENQKGDFRMLNERTYQILASGGFEVCDHVPGIEEFFPDGELVTAKTPGEWVDKVNYYVKHPDKREPYIQQGLKAVQKYSYSNVMNDLVKMLNEA